jgi:hypothetical protein
MTTQPRIEERRYWVCPTNFVWVGAEKLDGTFPFGFPGSSLNGNRTIRFETEGAALRALEAYVARVVEGGEEAILGLLVPTHSGGGWRWQRNIETGSVAGVPSRAKVHTEWRITAGAVIDTERAEGGVKVHVAAESRYVARWPERSVVVNDGVEHEAHIGQVRALTEWADQGDRGWTLEARERIERIEWWA